MTEYTLTTEEIIRSIACALLSRMYKTKFTSDHQSITLISQSGRLNMCVSYFGHVDEDPNDVVYVVLRADSYQGFLDIDAKVNIRSGTVEFSGSPWTEIENRVQNEIIERKSA